MIEPEPNCFQNWEPNNTPHLLLPSPDELVPLSQTLISPDLALAFDIKIPDSPDGRALKRPRLVWTPQLHKRFVDAVAQLGIKNAVPKTIMQLMGVDGLTRENVASHLQKYRLYLKRMQGIGSGSGGDPAMDRLFSSSPVPALFLQGGENLSPFSAVGATQGMQFGQGRFGGMGGIGSGSNGVLDCSFLMGQSQPRQGVIGVQGYNSSSVYVDDVAGGDVVGGRRVLTLFPMGEDD